MTKYYCHAGICKTHQKRQICCWQCMNFTWCADDMAVGHDCRPWKCGKSIRVSDYYQRYYNRLGYMELTGKGTFPIRKHLEKKLIAKHRDLLKGII